MPESHWLREVQGKPRSARRMPVHTQLAGDRGGEILPALGLGVDSGHHTVALSVGCVLWLRAKCLALYFSCSAGRVTV